MHLPISMRFSDSSRTHSALAILMATFTLLMSASDSPGTVCRTIFFNHTFVYVVAILEIADTCMCICVCVRPCVLISLHMGQDAYVSMILQASETFGMAKDEL